MTNDEGGQFSSIGAAVAGTASGGTISLVAGTFTENVTVNKQVTLDGTVNGSGHTVTTVQSAAADTPVITIAGSGAGTNSRLVVENVESHRGHRQWKSGQRHPRAGLQPRWLHDLLQCHVERQRRQRPGLRQHGQHQRRSGDELPPLEQRGRRACRIASSVPSFIGLTVSGSNMSNNGLSGFDYNPSGFASNVGTNFSFSNSTFTDNNTSATANTSDVSFFSFNGNAWLANDVTVASANSKAYGILFSGKNASLAYSNYAAAPGTVALSGVTVTGCRSTRAD